MLISDIFKINTYKQKIIELEQANAVLRYENDNLTQKNKILQGQTVDLQSFINNRLPLFDTNILLNPNNLEDFFHSWNQYWYHVDHKSYYQTLRQNRACEAYMTPLNIDFKNGTARFRGGESDYKTTLTACQCTDFQRHLKPCKHIYRLAYELNVFLPNAPISSVPDPRNLFRDADLSRVKCVLSSSSLQLLTDLICSQYIIVKTSDAEQLLRHNIAIIVPEKYELLSTFKKCELLEMLPNNVSGIKSLKKSILIEKIISDYPDVISKIEKEKIALKISPYASRLREHFFYL